MFDGGVVNDASFAVHPAPLAPGSITAIFGTDLNDGSDNDKSMFGSDGKLVKSDPNIDLSLFGSDGKLVKSLGGASVKIDGFAAKPCLQ